VKYKDFLWQWLGGWSRNKSECNGFIIYLLDVPICLHSKLQKEMTLSSTEAKYVAIFEAVKEVKLDCYLLCDLHIIVNLPIMVRTDNIGAIFMSENASNGLYSVRGHTLSLSPRIHWRRFYYNWVCPFSQKFFWHTKKSF
jgi:hypothetical protein